jgi:hypothetical protein
MTTHRLRRTVETFKFTRMLNANRRKGLRSCPEVAGTEGRRVQEGNYTELSEE